MKELEQEIEDADEAVKLLGLQIRKIAEDWILTTFGVFPCIEDVEEGDNNEVEANTCETANKADKVEDTEEQVEKNMNEADKVQDMEEQVEKMEQEIEDINGGERIVL